MIAFPQHGSCLCGDVAYELREAPQLGRGRPERYSIKLADGRLKRSYYCDRCSTRLWGPSRAADLAVLEPGTLDDTSSLRPVGHIWTRSPQSWVPIPASALNFTKQPREQDVVALVQAWKEQPAFP